MNYSCQEEADYYEEHPEEERMPTEEELFNVVYQWGKTGVVVDFMAPVFQGLIRQIKIEGIKENKKSPF